MIYTQPTAIVDTSVTTTERTIITVTTHAAGRHVLVAMKRLTDALLDGLGERTIDPETVEWSMVPADVTTTELVVSVSAEVAR